MSDIRPIRELLADDAELRAVLDDLNVKYVRIAANGHWSYEKLGRARHGRDALERGLLLRLADLIPEGRNMRSGEWTLRKYDGVSGPSILIERLPVAVADRLPQEVLAALKKQVKADGNGVLVGEPGSGKGALLLWLALQIPDQPVLYVAENPPSEFPGTHVMHVYPPSSREERRSLERFIRLSPTVMWDRVVDTDDLRTLYGFPGARRRWYTTDATSIRSALRLLTAATQFGCDARFSTLLHVASSVIGRPEARNLIVKTDGDWREAWSSEESALDLIAAYESSDIRRLGPTETSVPAISVEPKVQIADDFAAEAASAASPVETRPSEEGEALIRQTDSPHTIEVDDADLEEIERPRGDEVITGMLAKDEIRELREQGIVPQDEDTTLSRKVNPPEATKAYVIPPQELLTRHKEITKPAAYSGSIGPEVDDVEAIVQDDAVEQDAHTAIAHTEVQAGIVSGVVGFEEESDEDDESMGYSDVFSGTLDFDSLAEEMLSEISELESPDDDRALATDPNRLVVIEASETSAAVDDDDVADLPTEAVPGIPSIPIPKAGIIRLASEASEARAKTNRVEKIEIDESKEDSTREISMNERLSLLRKRREEK